MRKLFFVTLVIAGLSSVAIGTPVRKLIKDAGGSNRYPGAGYVVIYDSAKVDMKESGLSYYNEHKLIKILNSRGGKK